MFVCVYSVFVEVEFTLRLTVSQSVSMSWYRVPLWDLRPDITSYRNVAVWNLRSCLCGAPSLTRGRVCNLHCNHAMVQVAQNPKPYFTLSSETPPTWRSRFPYLYPQGTGWPSYTPGHWVFCLCYPERTKRSCDWLIPRPNGPIGCVQDYGTAKKKINYKIRIKVKELSLCLTRHYAMRSYGWVDV
jgi:hypothetical protein